AEDGIRDKLVTGVQTCALPISWKWLEANEQRELADARARQANDEKQAALYQAYRASLAAASAALEIHDVADTARHLKSAPTAMRSEERRVGKECRSRWR